jgi:hypothetical protein
METFCVARGLGLNDKTILFAGRDHISKPGSSDPRFTGGHPHTVTSDGYVTVGAPLETLGPWSSDYYSAVTILAITFSKARAL